VTEGTSTYNLKNSEGIVKSRQKEELSAILDHFNIQTENPIVILNQDVARSFLTTKDDSDKYRFFMKATLLEQISNDLTDVREMEGEIKITLDTKKQDLADQKEVVKVLAAKVQEFEVLDQLQDSLVDTKKMIAWGLVKEKEVELEKQEGEFKKAKSKVPPVEQQIRDTDVCAFPYFSLFSFL